MSINRLEEEYRSNMTGQEDSPVVLVPPEPRMEDDQPFQWRATFFVAIIGIALIAIAFTAGFMALYAFLSKVVWFDNDFVLSNRWTIPVGVLFFSLLVGLSQKYLHAPTVIHGGFVENMKEQKLVTDYRIFPGAFVSSIISLISGASVGPEGTLNILVPQISSWIRDKFRIARESSTLQLGFDMAALSSAYNGIVQNPFFTGVLATEYRIGKKGAATFLIWNLVAGLVGYLFYLVLGFPSFASLILFPPVEELSLVLVFYAILLGGVGTLIALFSGLSMKAIGRVMETTFGDRVVLRTLAAGVIFAVVGYFLPALLFSGEIQIHTILANPAGVGVAMLLLYAILKIPLLALSYKSGFIGGPIFPVLFSCTMLGLALSLVFPSVPVAIFVLCIEAAAFALALGVPLSAILLILVMSDPSPQLTVLVVTSATTGLVLGALVTQMKARRTPKQSTPVAEPA
jgi:H+/Cl- antiporter ClcA